MLHPVASSAAQDGVVDAAFSKFLENNDQFPAGAVVELKVWDPRFRPGSDTTFEPSVLLDAGCDENGVNAMGPVGQKLERPSPFNQMNVLDSSEIWGRSGPARQESVVMPLSEKDLSTRRHKKRLSYIQLNDRSEDSQEEQTANIGNSKCSIMLLKHKHCGISLLLPIGWVRAFWIPLVFAGGHVIGLRERHWIQTDAKLPSFPHDYPDCCSYDQIMAEKSAEYQETYNRKPPSKRGLWKSEVLGWEFVHEAFRLASWNVELHGGSSPESDPGSTSQPVAITDEGQDKKRDGSATDLEDVAVIKDHLVSNGGGSRESSMFVARTRQTLHKILRDCSIHDLPLLWESSEKVLSNGHPSSQLADDGSTELLKKGCLVRVLIHAPRKGVFDEGAIIYLPLLSDVDSYFCSSPRWQGFEDQSFKQVQQSWNTSCQSDIPEPRSECCSLRVAIGIITSGSVRGSASIKAIGVSEVAALGVLRARQLTDKRWPSISSEIFLLVRNKFSSMYRPALASIVAETSDDLE